MDIRVQNVRKEFTRYPALRDVSLGINSGELIAPTVKAGDKILFGKWSGTEVTINGEELLIMKESDILGIL